MCLEDSRPVRGIPSYKGQRHLPGRYWFATTARHVRYESLLERDILIVLDFDSSVTAVASQPFRLLYREDGRRRSHVPDLFVRRADGGGLVVDVKRARDASREKHRAAFEASRAACERAGWGYELVTEPEEPRMSNLRWLSGFRRTPVDPYRYAEALVPACVRPTSIATLSRAVARPTLVRPLLFHLLWCRLLSVDLTQTLTDGSLVGPTPASLEVLDGP